ncbi:MAG: acyl carrier protein [Candidatus Marinimicrobia bacterium]|jgi:acyl carrier protein|nr:acyl carrier protein [Candidatus Neomarinimicrobiota bacterium]
MIDIKPVKQKEIEEFIINYLRSNSGLSPQEDLTGLDFVDSGILDSFGILSMIMDVESRFSIKLAPENLVESRAKTVEGLASLIVNEMDNDEK